VALSNLPAPTAITWSTFAILLHHAIEAGAKFARHIVLPTGRVYGLLQPDFLQLFLEPELPAIPIQATR